jgi:hypothetical protein
MTRLASGLPKGDGNGLDSLDLMTYVANAGLLKAIDDLAAARDDLVILVAYMAAECFSAQDIAYAVEKPWKYTDILAEAKDLLEQVSS